MSSRRVREREHERPRERVERVYSPVVRGDRPVPDSNRTNRTERSEGVETFPRTRTDRAVQDPIPLRPDILEPPSSIIPPSGRTPNPNDTYPAPQGARLSSRTNEYFVPGDGIDRQVITADISRYLGNDAHLRAGHYNNPQTGQTQSGFFITAYRPLTTAMIADLKADSQRWQAEQRQVHARGRNEEYSDSTTHQSRQYYGPTTPASSAAMPALDQVGAYGSGYQSGYNQSSQYAAAGQGYPPDYDHAGSTYGAPAGSIPGVMPRHYDSASSAQQGHLNSRGNYYSDQTSTSNAQTGFASQPVSHGAYGSSQTPASAAFASRDNYNPNGANATQGYSQAQQADPYYGRSSYGGTAPSNYESSYQESSAYAQSSVPSVTSIAASSVSSRRERERESERDRHVHRRR